MKDDRSWATGSRPTRRRFLGQASCAAVGTDGAVQHRAEHEDVQRARAACDTGATAVLVCLFLSGGIDSFNVLVPRGPFGVRTSTRACGATWPFRRHAPADRRRAPPPVAPCGLHPGLVELQALFQANRLALLSNVGTLVAADDAPAVPERDRRAAPGPVLPLGPVDALADVAPRPAGTRRDGPGEWPTCSRTCNCNPNISMNISLSGSNVFQSGQRSAHYTITENGSVGLRDYGGTRNRGAGLTGGRGRPPGAPLPASVREDVRRTHARRDRRPRDVLGGDRPGAAADDPVLGQLALAKASG